MARLPLIDPETTSGDIRASFDRMPVKLNIFRMMAHAEAKHDPGDAARQFDPAQAEAQRG
ncbi:hypothetical protein ABH978_007393 [Bradyrhizobium ottawaense]